MKVRLVITLFDIIWHLYNALMIIIQIGEVEVKGEVKEENKLILVNYQLSSLIKVQKNLCDFIGEQTHQCLATVETQKKLLV
jgi:hypothetical protein